MESRRFSDAIKSFPIEELSLAYRKSVDFGVIDIILHPIDYADTLIRLGYEPFPPIEYAEFPNRRALTLPSLPKYMLYLYTIDGFSGWFRGLVPHVAEALINRHLVNYIMNRSPFPPEPPDDEPRLMEQFTSGNMNHFLQTRFWKMLSNLAALHISYPFHVLAVRTMARFVTESVTNEGYRPTIVDSWLDELGKIQAFKDLYAGCEARLVREIVLAIVSAGSYLAVMKIMQLLRADTSQADTIEQAADIIGNNVGTMYTTGFRNVADIMIINRIKDIPLGNPPFIEPFETCWDCFLHLREDRKWKVSSYLDRNYMGPIELVDGHLIPRNTFFGPLYLPHEVKRYEDTNYILRDYYAGWNKLIVLAGSYERDDSGKSGQPTEVRGEIKTLSMEKGSLLTGTLMTSVYSEHGFPFRLGL